MKRGIELSWRYNHKDQLVLRIEKKRGKLTVAEIQDLLMYEESQRYCGHYAILLNCSEAAADGGSLYLEEDQKGDAVTLYKIEDGETCPVCSEYTPPFLYCPACGTLWEDMEMNVEKLIASMKEETARMVKEAERKESRFAWYWSYIGALDMARQLGVITELRRQKLHHEALEIKEQIERG